MSAKVTDAHRAKADDITAECAAAWGGLESELRGATFRQIIAAALADAEAAEREVWVGLVKDAIENTEMSLPRFEDPDYGEMVRRLGDQIGYGALMSSAAASWKKKYGGGAFCCGPCVGTAEAWLTKARAAIRARGDQP